MLLSARVANVLSFREEQVLSFLATELNDGSARLTGIRERGKPVSIVPVIGLYGANASGKTNLLEALQTMRDAVLGSLGWLADPGTVRRVAFAFDPELASEPSFYEVDLVLADGVRHTYGFEIDDDRICGEWLHAYPRGRKQVWVDRDGDEIYFPGEGLRGEKLELVRRTRPDALFLSVAAQFNHEQLLPVFEWFRNNLWLVSPEETDWTQRLRYTRRRVTTESGFRERVARLLRVADLGIADVEVEPEAGRIRLLHQTGTRTDPLEFSRESLGTRSWFALLGPLLLALDQGSTLLVDELDASLHPAIAAEVVSMFASAEANPRAAQLLFTTHDTTLLRTLTGGGRVLDRDAIWLTEKDAAGATQLYPLTSIDPPPRKDANLERGYLLGRYGARPKVSPGELVREAEQAVRAA